MRTSIKSIRGIYQVGIVSNLDIKMIDNDKSQSFLNLLVKLLDFLSLIWVYIKLSFIVISTDYMTIKVAPCSNYSGAFYSAYKKGPVIGQYTY